MSARTLHRRSGLAMIAVLLVLMALFVLCAPFLITVRNADQASSETADRAVQRITLDMGVRHAEALLAPSHPALDATPYFDDLEELAVRARFPDGFLPSSDPTRPMWDVEALDVAGKIDLASASPHVLANLIGGAARLTALVKKDEQELELSGGDGFLAEGVVYVEQELVHYAQRDGSKLTGLTRGLLHEAGAEGGTCGPQPAAEHDVGAYVIDQRAWALCEWRLAGADVRAYDGIEELRDARTSMLGPELGRDAFLALERNASAYGHVRAGARWQRAVRMLGPVGGAPDYGCELVLDDTRWFNAGTTVRLSDGKNTEVALVRSVADGKLVLMRPLAHRFEAGETLVSPLARTPVNVNTASPAVLAALWTNLKLRGRSARLTAGEAKELVEVVLASRPFTGLEDFLRRVVLPAGGLAALPADAPSKPAALEKLERDAKPGPDGKKVVPGFLDEEDAVALYKCALNANDNELEFATMPLCFTSRDVYELATRAAVQAPSGVERARGVRETVELVVPQRELLSIWTRQEDFDEAPRLDTGSAGWISGPMPTSRFDPRYGVVHSDRWPTRARAHLGPDDTQPWASEIPDASGDPHVFAAREDDAGWAQLMPMREEDQARRASWALHFDDETRRLEGRFLPDAALPFDPAKARWTGSSGLLQGLAFSMWVQPRELEEGARLFDLAGAFSDTDRLSLVVEQGELVLRVLDAAGDHASTPFKEQAEVRYPLTGEGPGLPLETWSHVAIAVDGSRPDQLKLFVDGRRAQDTPGLTRLTGAINGESDEIPVESTEGFPDRCVLRIGDELIEAIKKGAKSFRARFNSVGENAGFGGRLARETYDGVEPEEVNQGLYKDTDHPAGTAVQLYGYSLPLFSNVPNAQGALRDELGMFTVARVDGIVHEGSDKQNSAMPPIQVQGDFGPFTVGWGIDGSGRGLDGLLLQSADPNRSLEDTMAGFNPGGGYAAILQVIFTSGDSSGGGGGANDGSDLAKDLFGVRIGGVEVVRYRGYSGRTLQITERGDQVRLGNLGGTGVDPSVKGRGAFIVAYDTGIPDEAWAAHAEELTAQVMVIPISVPVGASSAGVGFEPGQPGRSAFAQITHLGGEAHLTEWVRYDEISSDGQLVRDTSSALMSALSAATGGRREEEPDQPRPGGGGGGGGGGPGRGGTSALVLAPAQPVSLSPAKRPPAAQGGKVRGSYWDYVLGEREDLDFLVARAVASNFQFRGVLGTFIHPHPQGTVVLPVFRTYQLDETAGWPGRFDPVTFLSDVPTEPGFQGLVQHAHRPGKYTVWSYQDGGELTPAEAGEPVAIPHGGFDVSLTHVALQGALAVPFAATPIGSKQNPKDSRLLTRMTLFPSGELPRIVTRGQLGGDALAARGSVPSATVDEALFFPTFVNGPAAMPSQFVLDQPLAEGGTSAIAAVNTLRTTLGDFVDPGYSGVLGSLPAHGGLLSIGDEILAYEAYDTGTFTFVLPPAGRGLLGTQPAPHRTGEAITFLGALPCAILAASVGPDDALLPLLELSPGFPSQGTLWLEGELVHYTRVENGVLVMPRASSEPGEMDEKGPGLFRGRYGTPRAAHGVGTPVILWPFRYWDRWSELADAPEMSYYQLSLEQPDAFWRRAFWRQSAVGVAGPELFVLQRTNPATPWDAPPDELDPKTKQPNGLRQLSTRRLSGEGEPIGVQADRVEWRIHVRHQPGSFDALTGAAHGWKSVPKLELFGVEYLGPSRTYTRSER